jgi:hypothetical protein
MGGDGVTRGNTTTSQSGQRDGRNKGAQQEAKAQRESKAPADRRHQRDSPVLRLCFNTKGKKGGSGRMPNGTELLWQIEVQMTKQRQIPISLGYFCECIWTAFWALNW